MIFVTVGTYEVPFDRLLQALDRLETTEPLVVQRGPSAICPEGASCTRYLPFEEILDCLRQARVVITHAGVGSVMASLMVGKRPIVVPRRRRFGETVDDHQIAFARRLARTGLATVVEDPSDLREAITWQGSLDEPVAIESTSLVADLRVWIDGQFKTVSFLQPRR